MVIPQSCAQADLDLGRDRQLRQNAARSGSPVHRAQGRAYVNWSGRFQVMTSGYAVMSHVWEETMGWMSPPGFGKVELSLRKKGISRAHFLKFFDKYNSTWLWVNVLAMPEVLKNMNEIGLRVGVINNLDAIYRQADRVIVLDSLAMRLKLGSLLNVAVTLSLGR